MPDRFETMSILVRVVDEGSLTAGARALRMPIATVSRRISDLEEILGTELLLRSPRGLSLTDTGTAYLAACRRILEDLAEAERSASGEFTAPRGTLTMTAPIVFGRSHVLPSITAFLRAYPEVDVGLELTDRPVNLRDEHLDMAVRIGPLADSALIARKVGNVRSVVCASPAYLEEYGTPEMPGDLSAHHCITFQNLMAPQTWAFGAGRRERTVPIHSRLSVNTAEAAIDAAEAGLGFTPRPVLPGGPGAPGRASGDRTRRLGTGTMAGQPDLRAARPGPPEAPRLHRLRRAAHHGGFGVFVIDRIVGLTVSAA